MLISVLRSIILYVIIIVALRLMGKRQIGELQPSELVITILVSNIATLPIEDSSLPMLSGILPIMTLVCLDVVMSGITMKSRLIRRIVSGTPKVIIRGGEIDQKTLGDLRFTMDDVYESLHENGIFDINEVQYAIAETNGKISVYPKYRHRGVTNGDIGKDKASDDPPVVVISDGVMIEKALGAIGRESIWVDALLRRERVRCEDVFLLCADKSAGYTLIKKEKRKK